MKHPPITIFIHYLEQLKVLLEKAAESNLAEQDILQARLSEDMFPLHQQVTTALSFPIRACYPLINKPVDKQDCDNSSLNGLRLAVDETIQRLQAIPKHQLVGFTERDFNTKAGFAELVFSGDDFIHLYMLPNFFFHYTMVYGILRHLGVKVGKPEFDGFHQYPEGFSF
jgi:hypothetical protein